MEGVKWEGHDERERERCGEHLPVVMVHSLSPRPLSSLKMQDGERREKEKGGGVVESWHGSKFPPFSSVTFIISSSRTLLPLFIRLRRQNLEVSEEVNKRRD